MDYTSATMSADNFIETSSPRVLRAKLPRALTWVNPQVAADSQLRDERDIVELLQSLRTCIQRPIKPLKADRHSTVLLHQHEDRQWVIKHDHRPSWIIWIYHLSRLSPAWRQWRGAMQLGVAGVRVNAPLALIHNLKFGGCNQMLVLAYVDAPNLHDWLAGRPADRAMRLRVARTVGDQMGRITAAGLVNRDHKPTNLLIDDACTVRGEQPVLIDTAGIRRRRSIKRVLEMFHVMWRASWRSGPVSLRECVTVIRAAMKADPALRRRFATASQMARVIEKLAEARPLSYDPPASRDPL